MRQKLLEGDKSVLDELKEDLAGPAGTEARYHPRAAGYP